MSKELQVVVQQTPGTVHWNFEELKAGLAEKMEDYRNLVYTEETLTTAKQDVAMLRKLRKSVEDRRKEIKNKCLEPYAVIEDQAKQLTGLIDAPIQNISEQINKYEDERKKKKHDKIVNFMQKAFSGLDPVVAKRLQFKIYDSRWENKTVTDDEWLNAVNEALKVTEGDIEVINGIEKDFQPMCMEAYRQNLVLNEALAKANELRRQQEILRERERERAEAIQRQKEAEERRKAEELARKEEQERIRAEAQAQKEVQEQQEAQKPSNVVQFRDVNKNRADAAETAHGAADEPHGNPMQGQAQRTEPKQMPDDEYWILFKGSREQLKKVLGYIKFVGAESEVRNVVNR